jgi:hypothetical protein
MKMLVVLSTFFLVAACTVDPTPVPTNEITNTVYVPVDECPDGVSQDGNPCK